MTDAAFFSRDDARRIARVVRKAEQEPTGNPQPGRDTLPEEDRLQGLLLSDLDAATDSLTGATTATLQAYMKDGPDLAIRADIPPITVVNRSTSMAWEAGAWIGVEKNLDEWHPTTGLSRPSEDGGGSGGNGSGGDGSGGNGGTPDPGDGLNPGDQTNEITYVERVFCTECGAEGSGSGSGECTKCGCVGTLVQRRVRVRLPGNLKFTVVDVDCEPCEGGVCDDGSSGSGGSGDSGSGDESGGGSGGGPYTCPDPCDECTAAGGTVNVPQTVNYETTETSNAACWPLQAGGLLSSDSENGGFLGPCYWTAHNDDTQYHDDIGVYYSGDPSDPQNWRAELGIGSGTASVAPDPDSTVEPLNLIWTDLPLDAGYCGTDETITFRVYE